MRQTNPPKPKKAAMLGVGLDNTDGDKRLTRGKNFTLVGGSAETRAVLQETAVKINERLDKKGKRLEDAGRKSSAIFFTTLPIKSDAVKVDAACSI